MGACTTALAAAPGSSNPAGRGWPEVFPQHGLGKKHTRRIALAGWQRALVAECPHELSGHGVNRKTSVAAKTTTTWKVTLKAGTYTLRSDTNAKLKRTLVVKA